METNNDPNTVVLDSALAQPKPFDLSMALRWVGAALLAVTGFLIWKEVSLDAVFLMLGGSVATMVASFVLEKKQRALIGPVASLVALVVAGCWYGATRDPIVIGSLAIGLTTFAGLSWLNRKRATGAHRLLSFQGVAWAGLALSLATDFHLFHASELGDENFLARRVILTVLWLVPGIALLVFGGKREDRALQAAGVVLTIAALGKLLIYDTVALDGVLRIASYGLAGAVTLLGGQLLTRKAVTS